MFQSLALFLFLSAAVFPQESAPSNDLRLLAFNASRAGKILMVRFEPSGVPDVWQLDRVIAGDADLKAAFAKTFQVESRTSSTKDGAELHKKLGNPFRGIWPGVALVDRSGELLSIVDASSWKTDGKWDPARLKSFVEFWSQQGPKSDRLKEVKEKYGQIYDPKADPKADIAAVVARAKSEGKHVLVKIGGNWCGWCYLLHDEFETRPKLKEMLERSYVLVRVNWDRDNKNEDVMAQLENPTRFGFPVLVVLDGEGRRLHTQDSGLLEVGDHHDPKQVEAFLNGWTVEALKPKKTQ